MSGSFSRRRMLQGSAAATAGAVGVAIAADGAEAGTGSASQVGAVVRAQGGTAEVAVPANAANPRTQRVAVQGFPDGWSLRRGDLVLVTPSDFTEAPHTAMPLITRLVGQLEGRTKRADAVRVGGHEVTMRPATMRSTTTVEGRRTDGSQHEAYCVRNRLDDSLTCIALRPIG